MARQSIAQTQQMLEEALRSTNDRQQAAVLQAMLTTLEATGMGECQIKSPPAPLYPVLSPQGLRYCCTHEDQHCSGILD